jgi:uncharacterized membrane protein
MNDVNQGNYPEQPTPPPPPPKKDNTVMLVLSYIWILFLVPLLTEKDDPNVQWHAKHGLVITIAEFALQFGFWIVSFILSQIVSAFGCLGCFVPTLIWVAFLIIRILCIVKATKGERFIIPGVSQYVERINF